MKPFSVLLFAFMVLVALTRPANAQAPGLEVNVMVLGHAAAVTGSSSDHFLTFSAPVEIPGVGLAPGAYIFRFIAPSVMQVLNENRSMVYGTFFVNPTWRSEITNEYAVTLRRIRNDAPARIETLFPPGASAGYELTYPKLEIAAAAEQLAMK